MRILLDTHIFLWLVQNNPHLSDRFCQIIQDPTNEKYLSVVSVWECTIKYQIGKLDFPESPEIYLPLQRRRHLIKTLEVDEKSIIPLVKLPPLHKDPFDRLIIAQSIQHNLAIMTEDKAILAYPDLNLI